MRLPFIQVTQETWDYARSLAALTGQSIGTSFIAVCDLWRWGIGLGDPDAPPSGLCENARADRLLVAALNWPSNGSDLVQALADLGLVEVRPNGHIRVRGMGRYKRTWEKNRRKPARQVPETGTNPAPPAPEPARQTQTQTQTHIEAKEEALSDSQTNPPPVKPPKAPRADKPPDPRHAPMVKALVDAAPGYAFTGRDAKAVSALLSLAGDPEILRRWEQARQHVGFPTVRSLSELVTHWNHFAADGPVARAAGPPRRPGARVGAEEIDWSQAKNEVSNEI